MRSTPARLLRQDQLLVERYGVNKITEVDHAIPHNTVTVEHDNQMTGAPVHAQSPLGRASHH